MGRRAVITGIGVVNPAGIGKDAFWRSMVEGRSALAPISRFDASRFPVRVAGQINGFEAKDFIPRRFIVKTDRFTHFALAAAELALADARLDLGNEDLHRVGVWFGNNAGGWDICERGFHELYREGATLVNPWQATAWFPTAPQGYLTIRYGIRGYSKSFVCDRASGASALYFAERAIRLGHNDVILAGGTEAPITAFGVTCYHETGELSAATDPATAYRPFDRRRDGVVLGEGSAVLILEEAERAARRGATIYGEIAAGALSIDPDPAEGLAYGRAIREALKRAGLAPRDVDVIFAEGAGTRACDRAEARALAAALGDEAARIPVTVPKSMFGHLYGASAVTEAACGLLAGRTSTIPPTAGFVEPDPECPVPVVTRAQERPVRSFLVGSRSREGASAALVFKVVPAAGGAG